MNGMPRCYSLLLGARNTGSRTHRFSASDERRIREITFRHFPEGFTVLNADGGWFDPTRRRFVREESRQILICTDERRRLASWCAELRVALRQDELLVIDAGVVRVFSAAIAGRRRRSLGRVGR